MDAFIINNKKTKYISLAFSPLISAGTTLVENGTRLIRTTDLYLHKVRPMILTLGACSLCTVDVLPRVIPTQDVVYLLLGNWAGHSPARAFMW